VLFAIWLFRLERKQDQFLVTLDKKLESNDAVLEVIRAINTCSVCTIHCTHTYMYLCILKGVVIPSVRAWLAGWDVSPLL